MITLSIVLDKRRAKKDGSFPLKIRIFKSPKTHLHSLGISIQPNQWESNGKKIVKHSNSKLLNAKVNQTYSKVEQLILDAERDNPDLAMTDIKLLLNPKKQKPTTSEKSTNDIIAFGEMLIKQQQESGRYGNAATYQTALDVLAQQFSTQQIPFESIDYVFLNKWEASLKKKTVKVNSIGAYMRAIRAIYNQAIKSGVVEQKHYPFTKYKIKSEKTVQRTLTKSQINTIRKKIHPKGSMMEQARDLFLLSFYLRGMNFRDMALLTNEDIQGNRIIYRRSKTHKVYSVKIIPKAKRIITKYRLEDGPLLLPIIPSKHCCNKERLLLSAKDCLKNYNYRYYHEIGKEVGITKMTTYYAR